MTLQELYIEIGGNYQEALSRLMNDTIAEKFVLKFINDKSYETLCRELANGNAEEAFRAAHTLKGVCANLSMTKLFEVSSELTEALRDRNIPDNASELLNNVTVAYESTVNAINKYSESK